MGEAQTTPLWRRGPALMYWLPVARNLRDLDCFDILGTHRSGQRGGRRCRALLSRLDS